MTYAYDEDGNVISLADANGNLTSYCHDGFGRVKEARYPSAAVPGASVSCAATPTGGLPSTSDYQAYQYDAASNIVVARQRDGQTIASQFDAQDRLKLKDVPEADRDVTYVYDLLGRMKAANLPGANAGLSITWDYDKLGRPAATTSAGRTLAYGYGTASGQSTLTWPDSKTATYTTDPAGRPKEIWGIAESTGGNQTASPRIVQFEWDRLSRPKRLVLGNSTSTNFSYDSNQRLSALGHTFPNASANVNWTFGYNEAGQIKTTTRDADRYAWLDQYNVVRPYESNGRNQYIKAGPRLLLYDGRGNLVADGGWTFNYDSENRMLSATGLGQNAVFSYDALGRLARQQSGTAVTQFLYDDLDLVAEYDGSGALIRRTVHGPGTDQPMLVYEDGVKQYLYADVRGSIIALADGGGAALSTVGYGPDGQPTPEMIGRFAYTGQTRIPEIGLYYYKARMYSPWLGRFMQTDPIGYEGGMNLYAYGDGDPVNNTDPLGLQSNCGTADPGTILVCGRRPGNTRQGTIGSSAGVVNVGRVSGGGAGNSALAAAAANAARRANGQSNSNSGGTSVFSKENRCASLYVLDFAGKVADVGSVVALGGAAAATATGAGAPVGAFFLGGAVTANRISATTSFASIPLNIVNLDLVGTVSSVAGAVAGRWGAKGVRSIASLLGTRLSRTRVVNFRLQAAIVTASNVLSGGSGSGCPKPF